MKGRYLMSINLVVNQLEWRDDKLIKIPKSESLMEKRIKIPISEFYQEQT